MKYDKLILLFWVLILFISCSNTEEQVSKEIFVCDQNSKKVMLLPIQGDWNDSSSVIWSWSSLNSLDIPENERKWYDYLSDAKPVKNLSHLLIVGGSGGGIALVRISDKKVIFHGYGGKSPHSAELLPDGNIIVASSQDNHLRVFYNISDNTKYKDLNLISAHGVVWDFEREKLWAVGLDSLYKIQYNSESEIPFLSIEKSYQLPTREGHDLFPRKNGETLFVITKKSFYEFNPKTEVFDSFEPYSRINDVKSISELSNNGQLAIVQATISWWSDTVILLNPDQNKRMYGARFYKARWNTTNTFSYGRVIDN